MNVAKLAEKCFNGEFLSRTPMNWNLNEDFKENFNNLKI